MAKDFKAPSIEGREFVSRFDIELGDVVGFVTEYAGKLRIGFMCLSPNEEGWFQWAINLYKEEGRVWTYDEVPSDGIIFFKATDEEKLYVYKETIKDLADWIHFDFDPDSNPCMMIASYLSKIKDIINTHKKTND